jgi:8-oxo-dGTP pyrophosphatase MutT (NUDIX family)
MQPKPEEINHHFACVFLITRSGRIVGQLRDDRPGIDNPGKVGAFGGTIEPDEDPLSAAYRELVQEETNLKITKSEIEHLVDDVAWRELTNEWEVRHFYYVNIDDSDLETMEVYEGQGWAYINGPKDTRLIKTWQSIIETLIERLNRKV